MSWCAAWKPSYTVHIRQQPVDIVGGKRGGKQMKNIIQVLLLAEKLGVSWNQKPFFGFGVLLYICIIEWEIFLGISHHTEIKFDISIYMKILFGSDQNTCSSSPDNINWLLPMVKTINRDKRRPGGNYREWQVCHDNAWKPTYWPIMYMKNVVNCIFNKAK